MIRFITLFSGSSGNATLISGRETNILIDAGVSCAKICASLSELGISPNELDAVLITHEHSDHVNGVRVLSKKFNIPVYATEKTLDAMNLYDVYAHNQRAVKSGERFEIREFEIFPFSIPHDAADPVGYSVLAENEEIKSLLESGMVIAYAGYTENIDGRECYVFVLGTDHEDHIVNEYFYGVCDNLIYVYDVLDDSWNAV